MITVGIRATGLEPAISVEGSGFRDRCVYQFRHARMSSAGE
jgi:hypothetical protein